jgi:hypothetical protein
MAVHIVNTAEETLSAQQGRLTPYRLGGLDLPPLRSHYVLMNEGDGQLHTLTVLEQLREASKSLWGASSAAYFRMDELLRQLANPNLHDIPRNLPFRVEMWDPSDQHVRWMIAASASVAVGHAAMDAAIANYPEQRFTLRNGILVIRQQVEAGR